MLIGVRDVNLLASALGRQCTTFGGKSKYNDKLDICATLFYGMVKNHSFSDGNKRTALLLLLYQLELFGYVVVEKQRKFERLVVSIAANQLPEDYKNTYRKFEKEAEKKDIDPLVKTISCELRKLVKKKDHSYHINPTMKEVQEALQKQGVEYDIKGNKIHFQRIVKNGFFKKPYVYSYTASFSGWTRCVGAETMRKLLENLNLYDQYASYRDFIDGKEMLYELVDGFNGPLRRLKDK